MWFACHYRALTQFSRDFPVLVREVCSPEVGCSPWRHAGQVRTKAKDAAQQRDGNPRGARR
jgi:hypothetical protein